MCLISKQRFTSAVHKLGYNFVMEPTIRVLIIQPMHNEIRTLMVQITQFALKFSYVQFSQIPPHIHVVEIVSTQPQHSLIRPLTHIV